MQKINFIIQKIIGYILLSPALMGVFMFFKTIVSKNDETDFSFKKLINPLWTGSIDYFSIMGRGGGGGGYTSALPFYFGLMAMAGAYLIKESNPKK